MRCSLVLASLFAVLACRGGDRRRASTESAAARDAGVVALDAAPARGGADDPLAEKLRHCPVAVDGAATAWREHPDGVEATITARDPAAVDEIRRRAGHLVALTAGQARRGEHGGGAGGGFMQNCPVVVRDTAITATYVEGGAVLVVRPTGALTMDALRAETRRRQDAFTAP